MIKQTIFATFSEDSRPFLSSMLWEIGHERLMRLVATDINRLALREAELEACQSQAGRLIPVRALARVGRASSGAMAKRESWF